MSDVDFLVKLRDACIMIADACDEQLEKKTPLEIKYSATDFEKLVWETRQGAKGEFEQTSKQANNNSEVWQGLQKLLKMHSGFMTLGAYKLWFH